MGKNCITSVVGFVGLNYKRLEPKPQTLIAVSCGGFFSSGHYGLNPGTRIFSYNYHRQQIADGGQIPRQNRDKKTPDISVGGSRGVVGFTRIVYTLLTYTINPRTKALI